jgi:hypothetical protein
MHRKPDCSHSSVRRIARALAAHDTAKITPRDCALATCNRRERPVAIAHINHCLSREKLYEFRTDLASRVSSLALSLIMDNQKY